MKNVIIFILSIFIFGCDCDRNISKFKQGDIVESIISGDIGMVISVYKHDKFPKSGQSCYIYYYDVRFSVKQSKTNTHLLNNDDPISTAPLAIIEYMREYELKLKAKGD